MTAAADESVRRDFEVWGREKGFDLTRNLYDVRYSATDVQYAWMGYEAARSSASAAPEGWVCVPKTLTKAMERAAFDELEFKGTANESGTMMRNRVYAAMLAAAPLSRPQEDPDMASSDYRAGWNAAMDTMTKAMLAGSRQSKPTAAKDAK